ncbi:glycosyltransferase family 2 protein [Candidatus Microgenomates bacterium]|nr:MAG: glycosyltransferase family 2 protein [Candidatus Microgenomates bacterium]
MKKISVVISAFNEEEKITECLESVKWADEIILVDNESTDKTVEIAKNHTSNIISRKNNLMLNVNKNFGFTKASGDWILCLDADERVSSELKNEIKLTIEKDTEVMGYFIPRKNIIFTKWIKHTGWYPDYQSRLFKNGKGKFAEKHVHEMIEIEGKTEYLKENLIHYNFESISQFLHKHINIYAPNEVDNIIAGGYKFDYLDAIRFPIKEFLSRFFAREGYKDGLHGLVLSLFMAFYHFIIFAYLWEKQGFPSVEKNNFLQEMRGEFKKINKDIMFWFSNEQTKMIKNPLIKILHKVRKKLLK